MNRRFNHHRDNQGYNTPEENRSRNRNYDNPRNTRWPENDRDYDRQNQDWRPFESQHQYGPDSYGYKPYEPYDSYRDAQRYRGQGYNTTQDYSDMEHRRNESRWNDFRNDYTPNYENPYQRQTSYRPYESGYDAPWNSMTREHYQPTSYQGNYYGRPQPNDYDMYNRDYGRYSTERESYEPYRQQQNFRGVGPRNYTRSDERITEDVNDRLNDNPYIDASDIQVKVKQGEVVLEGNVDSRYAKHLIEDIADSVSGVKDVENHIHIKRNLWEKDSNADTQQAESKNKLSKTAN